MHEALLARFWAKVDKTETCWLWTAYTCDDDYGVIRVYGKLDKAHRLSYTLFVGEIPAGYEVDHKCFVHACVRPEHLRVCTTKQNRENRPHAYASSKTGIRGVSWYKPLGKYVAKVRHNGKSVHVGYFDDIGEAELAVIAKRNELFTHNDADRRAK